MPFVRARSRHPQLLAVAAAVTASLCWQAVAVAQADPLPSWNDGPAKQAIVRFVQETTDPASKTFLAPEKRVAAFDQDGTLWVEQPIYTQVVYCLERVPSLVKRQPRLRTVEPFKTVLSGDRQKIAKLSLKDFETIAAATLSGMSVGQYRDDVHAWIASATHPRWHRPYTQLVYQPMLEVMQYLRANGYRTYIVTGGGQDFVRVYADRVYGVPREQIVGSAGATRFGYDKAGRAILMKEPKLLLINDGPGKPEGINLVIGRRPAAAFGNSDGDRQMLEYTGAGKIARLEVLVLHDDAEREFAYGPATGLPDSKVGTFSQSLYDEAQQRGWTVISMKKDWKRIFPGD